MPSKKSVSKKERKPSSTKPDQSSPSEILTYSSSTTTTTPTPLPPPPTTKGKKSSNQPSKKTRFTPLDCVAIVHTLTGSSPASNIIGCKVLNIYDLDIGGQTSGGANAPGGSSSVNADGSSGVMFKFSKSGSGSTAAATDNNNNNDDDDTSSSTTDPNKATSAKPVLLIHPQSRLHLTSLQPNTSGSMTFPSSFTMKLRKHVRNSRLVKIEQLGGTTYLGDATTSENGNENKNESDDVVWDRVIKLTFQSASSLFHLIVELYSKGNLILTDDTYTILACVRKHEYKNRQKDNTNSIDEGPVDLKVGNVYPITYATSFVTTSIPTPKPVSVDDENITPSPPQSALGIVGRYLVDAIAQSGALILSGSSDLATLQKDLKNTKKGKSKQNRSTINLKELLLLSSSPINQIGVSMIDHLLMCTGLSAGDRLDPITIMNDDNFKFKLTLLDKLAITEIPKIINTLKSNTGKGYIIHSVPKGFVHGVTKNEIDKTPEGVMYYSFEPTLLSHHVPHLESGGITEFSSYSLCVDDFFVKIASQKMEIRRQQTIQWGLDKTDRVKKDQHDRLLKLKAISDDLGVQARTLEFHASIVDNALSVISDGVASGMDWEALGDLVDLERENGNPVASIIKGLDLKNELMSVSLERAGEEKDRIENGNEDENEENGGGGEDNEDEEGGGTKKETNKNIVVLLKINISAHANGRLLFIQQKEAQQKEAKTSENSHKALKASEDSVLKSLKKLELKDTLAAKRELHWFEKFYWFVTSDNYLAISGRDGQQNELLVTRFMRNSDLYVSADVEGSNVTIVRSKRRSVVVNGESVSEVVPFSAQALKEAGCATLCRSSAWKSRMITSAWFVEKSQVSKTMHDGQLVTTIGSFVITGKKNFLPPTSLEMGFGLLFRLGDEVSVERHKGERRDYALEGLIGDAGDGLIGKEEVSSKDEISSKDEKRGSEEEEEEEEAMETATQTQAVGDGDGEDEESADVEDEDEDEGEIDDVDDEVDESEEVDSVRSTAPPPPASKETKEKKGLSAYDRKQIKKFGSLQAANEKKSANLNANANAKVNESTTPKPKSEPIIKDKVATRGSKKSKKKIAKKYADQDDEDRELALLALHGMPSFSDTTIPAELKGKGSKKNFAIKKSSAQLAAEEVSLAVLIRNPADAAGKLSDVVRAILESVTVPDASSLWSNFDADSLEALNALPNLVAQIAVAKRFLQLTETSKVENFASCIGGIIRAVLKHGHVGIGEASNKKKGSGSDNIASAASLVDATESNSNNEECAEIDDSLELDLFTANPTIDDVVLYAVPVCASSMSQLKYKYRAKFVPGTLKRGKAAKQCHELFLKLQGANGNGSGNGGGESAALKMLDDNEMAQAGMGDVKVSSSGVVKGGAKNNVKNKKK